MESEQEATYSFVPYKYGAFSFTSYADKRLLIRAGLLDEGDKVWRLTEAGRLCVKRDPVEPLRARLFSQKHALLRGKALIVTTYSNYPYYATRSQLLDNLKLEPETLQKIAAAKPSRKAAGLLTIGYEGRSFESYLNALILAGVTVLCDVRRNPLSRKYGFSKTTLSGACNSLGIKYEHMPQLGIESRQRKGLETQADYDELFSYYEREYLPGQLDSLDIISTWVKGGHRVALTCYERLASKCHRHCVAKALEKLGVDVEDL